MGSFAEQHVELDPSIGNIVGFRVGALNTIDSPSANGDGWIDDDLSFVKSWEFDLGQIQIPVLLLHGKQDYFVPVHHGEWLLGQIPGVESRILPDDGHITLLVNRISEVHSWLKNKMV